MKRILLSLAGGFLLVTVYLIVVVAIFLVSGQDRELLPYLAFPMKLPKAMFYYLFPSAADDYVPGISLRNILGSLIFYVGNAVLYAIPFYPVWTLILLRRKKVQVIPREPPLPPTF